MSKCGKKGNGILNALHLVFLVQHCNVWAFRQRKCKNLFIFDLLLWEIIGLEIITQLEATPSLNDKYRKKTRFTKNNRHILFILAHMMLMNITSAIMNGRQS